jgi:2'-5' RNA ligase
VATFVEGAVSSTFAEAWRLFEDRPRTKPSLAVGRSDVSDSTDYLIYLISLDQEPAVADAASQLQSGLTFPYVSPVPGDALHITVQSVGYRDRLTTEQQGQLVEEAAAVFESLAPFEAKVGGANSFDVAAFLEVHDGGVLRTARARLRAALPWLATEGRDPLVRDGFDIYLPHVSIAYYNAEADAREAVAALSAHREEVVAKVRIETVKLVAVRLPVLPTGVRATVEATFPLSGG